MVTEQEPPPRAETGATDWSPLVESLREEFRAAWRAGGDPRVESLLDRAPEPARPGLVRELVALEIRLRAERGERPDPDEYRRRFPDAEAPADGPEGRTVVVGPDTAPYQGPDPALAPTLPCGSVPEFDQYELIEELARGGMGVIYKARQRNPNRIVALKMILTGPLATEAHRERFEREAEAAASLDHPNIVPVYEVGEHRGWRFYSMRLIDGPSLARKAPELASDPRAAARLVATVARAVHHAHERGLLHRDLKPANILVDGEGRPYVADFGLARRMGQESGLTNTGAIMGTPSYMAPEQASGPPGALTRAADIYSLGAILYELLTGRPPFRAATVMETLVLVLEREPEPPSRLRPGLPRELEEICLKCLEKDPAARFASAAELAEQLERFLRGEDVEERRSDVIRHLRRWTRREPQLVARLGGLGIITLLSQYNYISRPNASPLQHYAVIALLAAWAAGSVGLQRLSRRGAIAEAVRCAWIITDLALLTAILRTLDAQASSNVVAYPLLVAASGLWFRVRLVWFTTIVAEVSYALLAGDAWLRGAIPATDHPNIVMAAIAVTGFVVARQVKRILALSQYYEHRRSV